MPSLLVNGFRHGFLRKSNNIVKFFLHSGFRRSEIIPSSQIRQAAKTAVTAANLELTINFAEGSLEDKLPTIWGDGKGTARKKLGHGESQKGEDERWRKSEDAGVRKGKEVAKHYVFPMFCGSGGSSSRLAKPAGAEVAGQMGDAKLHAAVARSTF